MKGLISPRFFVVAAVLAAAGGLVVSATGCGELSARRKVQEGNKLYKEGKYELAIEQFHGALETSNLEIAQHNCGLAHLKIFGTSDSSDAREAHAKRAVEHFLAYLEKQPKDDKIVSAMIKLYVDSGDYEGAITYWKKQLEIDARNVKALTELANINEKALRFDAALGWHQKRYEIATTHDDKVNALNSIGSLQFRRLIGDKDLFGADRLAMADLGIAAFKDAAELQPNNEQLFALQDALYQQRGIATDVSWAQGVEGTSALINRLKWRDIFEEKQKASRDASNEAGSGDQDTKAER